MGETLTEAVNNVNDPTADQPEITIEPVNWRDIARRLQLNLPFINEEEDKRQRPVTTIVLDPKSVSAGKSVRYCLPEGTRSVEIWNETTGTIRRSFNDMTSNGCGSIPIPAGQGRQEDVFGDSLWIWSQNAAGINDGSTNGITIEVGI